MPLTDEKLLHALRADQRLHRRSVTNWAIYLLIILIVVSRAYVPTLTAGWTDADALADVVCAGQGIETVLRPLTCGWGGDNANFWRPVAMFQYWLLRAVFGWNAPVWHVWALALHAATALLLASVVRRAGAGRLSAAGAGLLFAGHPLGVEIVPAIARMLEIPFCLGFLGALRFVGTRWFWPFAIMAIGSKEAAVLLLPALFALEPRKTPWLPLVGVLIAFLVGRTYVLDGAGGYGGLADLRVFLIGPLELLLPSLAAVAPPLASGGVGWVFSAWLALAGTSMLALRGSSWRLGLAMLLVILGSFAIYAVTGVYSRRLLYLPSAAWCVLAVLAAGRLASAGPGWGFSVFGVWLAGWLHGSPVWRPYTDWNEAGHAFDPWLSVAHWDSVADGETVWIVDRPARFDLDPRRVRYWTEHRTLNHTATLYSLEAWVREFTGKQVHLEHVSSLSLAVGVAQAGAHVQAGEGTVTVIRREGIRKPATKTPFTLRDSDGVLHIGGTAGHQIWVWNGVAFRAP